MITTSTDEIPGLGVVVASCNQFGFLRRNNNVPIQLYPGTSTYVVPVTGES
jgi:hypothetical protein